MLLSHSVSKFFRIGCARGVCFCLVSILILSPGCATKPVAAPQTSTTEHHETAPAQSSTPPPHAKPDDRLKQAAAQPTQPFEGEGWQSMFDGQTPAGWSTTPFAGHGEVKIEFGLILLNMGDPFTGINWTNDFPKVNYEIALDAMRVSGSDFFCGLTVPVRDSFCSLIAGGWGGALVGISSLNRMDASENETTKYLTFEQYHWYRIRLRVTEKKIEAWIDTDKLVDVDISDKQISVRPGDIEMSKPLGLACWQTTAAYREIKWRAVSGPASPAK
jgi:hypothetical protein